MFIWDLCLILSVHSKVHTAVIPAYALGLSYDKCSKSRAFYSNSSASGLVRSDLQGKLTRMREKQEKPDKVVGSAEGWLCFIQQAALEPGMILQRCLTPRQ